jgi:hypothetical protein
MLIFSLARCGIYGALPAIGAGFWVVTAGDISRVRVPSPWE